MDDREKPIGSSTEAGAPTRQPGLGRAQDLKGVPWWFESALKDVVTNSGLFRLGALSAVIGGALMLLDALVHVVVDDTLQPRDLGGLPHESWNTVGIVGVVLALLGLVAIYLGQSGQAGKLGSWACGGSSYCS